MTSNKPRLCFIGFGEAGQAIAAGLREAGVESIAAWDILFPKDEGARLKQAGEKMGARLASSAADAVAHSDIIVAAVTASSSLEAAQSVAPHISGNPYYLDINSVSPGRKKDTARLLEGTARYVDVAILAPIHPKRHQTPLLLAGPHAQAVMPLLIDELEMQGAIASDEIGAAAGLKMIRSVMIKGIEALTAECFMAAQRAGIADEVAASLKNNYPGLDWPSVIDYNLERMASHGIRRADEMEQSAVTLTELGIAPLMTNGTVVRQRELGELGKRADVKAAKTEGRAAILRACESSGFEDFLSPHPEEPCAAWRLEGRGRAWSPWPSFEARPRGRAPQDEVGVWCSLLRMGTVAYCAGGICRNSASCSLVIGASRNLSATASFTMPSRSAICAVCSASFG